MDIRRIDDMESIVKRVVLTKFSAALVLSLLMQAPAYSLDGKTNSNGTSVTRITIHEAAWHIRQKKEWQILEASPKTRESGYQYFRFKLLRHDGKVKVINIDPLNPNLRTLE